MSDSAAGNEQYWDELAAEYQAVTRISCADYHYGPLLPGDGELGLLPPEPAGRRCLELACGAGQNSIGLARRGADCIALDISGRQLAHGRQLAAEAGVEVDFRRASIDALPPDLGRFDLVHSSFGLPFAADPEAVIQRLAKDLLNPGATVLCSYAHPVFAGEWLEIDEEGEGMFLRNYFRPPADVRWCPETDLMVQSRSYPVSKVIRWHLAAGLAITAVAEPQPLPLPTMTAAEIAARVPYDSPAWRELYPQISRVPVVLIVRAEDRGW